MTNKNLRDLMTKKIPKGEVFEGRTGEMKDSPWLASEDLLDLDECKLTIDACLRHRNVEFEQGRKEERVYTLQFKEHPKQLVLNSVNRKTLVAKFGPNVKLWAGKEILLYVDKNVKFRGRIVYGIRIK